MMNKQNKPNTYHNDKTQNEHRKHNKISVALSIPLLISLFWGSLWGIIEATLGYLAHLFIPLPGVVGFIFFPIGFYFMMRAFKSSGKAWTIMSTASVASAIKLVDLFLPGLNPVYTINPAVSIVLEALTVFVAVTLLNQPKRERLQFRFRDLLAASVTWRLGFLCYSLILYFFSVSPVLIEKGGVVMIRFLLLEGLVNALIISGFLKIKKSLGWFSFSTTPVKPVWAAYAFSGAIMVELVLASL